jgi:acyl-CoA synthetase (NDP forming)
MPARQSARRRFQGAIGLIDPNRTRIDGLPCVGRLADLPDLVIFAAPRESTAAVVEEAGALKIPATVVITADPEHEARSLFAPHAKRCFAPPVNSI